MPNPPYNVVLIGYGAMGLHHFRILRKNVLVNIIAVVDPHLHELPGIKTVRSIEEMQWEPGWIAWIATPASTHADLISKLLSQGLHVFVEKPLCLSGQQASELIELAKSRNLFLFVGHSERYHPAFVRLLNQIKNSASKEIVRVSCHRTGPMPKAKLDCGVAFDLVVHDLDCVHTMIGNQVPIRIACEKKNLAPNAAWEDEIQAVLEYPDGVVVEFLASRIRTGRERTISVWTKTQCLDANLLDSFTNPEEEPLFLEHKDFFRILETKDWFQAHDRLESSRLAVMVAERLISDFQ